MPELFEAQTVPMTHDISLVYNAMAGDKVIEVLQNNPAIIRNTYGLEGVRGCANALLRELRCYASIGSLPLVPLPNIQRETPESDKIVAINEFEWRTARFELVVFKRAKHSGEWVECGVTALKNSAGHRYRLHRIIDLVTDDVGATVGEWGRIGVAVRAAGYGYPQSWDRISITGGWIQEFTWCQSRPTYVEVNNYGGSTATPTPTPTPTPPPVPTLTLALATGSTSAIANTDEKISLTVANIPIGTQLTGSWFKDGVDTAIAETVTTTGSAIELSTLKLRDKLSGQYSLRLFYNDAGYLSNAVSVTVNPEVTLVLPSGTTSASTGSFTPITISGKYFPTNTAVTYQWLKAPTDSSGLPAGTFAPVNGTFTTTQDASIFQAKGTGNYRLAVYLGSNTTPHYSNEISVTQTTVPTVVLNRSSADISNYYATDIGITIRGFTVNDVIVTTWFKADAELPTSAVNRTYVHNITNGFYYTWPVNNFTASLYNGAGVYKLRVTRGGVTIFSGNVTINDVRATEQPPALG